MSFYFFFFNDTATTEIYTLSLHDALPISTSTIRLWRSRAISCSTPGRWSPHWTHAINGIRAVSLSGPRPSTRSEEHTSELQSRLHLVCRLLLEKKKNN